MSIENQKDNYLVALKASLTALHRAITQAKYSLESNPKYPTLKPRIDSYAQIVSTQNSLVQQLEGSFLEEGRLEERAQIIKKINALSDFIKTDAHELLNEMHKNP